VVPQTGLLATIDLIPHGRKTGVMKTVKSGISEKKNTDFKPIRSENTAITQVKQEKKCPSPDLNRGQLDLQSSALPN
jgi:hypothetical protein